MLNIPIDSSVIGTPGEAEAEEGEAPHGIGVREPVEQSRAASGIGLEIRGTCTALLGLVSVPASET